MLATLAQEPLLALGDVQAGLLGQAVANASKYYNFAPDGKVMSLVSLGAAAMIVYVPMFGAIREKRRAARAATQNASAASTPEQAAMRAGMVDLSGDIPT